MPLDSDVSNADSQLHVEFYECAQEGPYKGKPFVRIVVPGDKTNVIDQPVREDHKRRFQRQWLFFQAQNASSQIIGTPLLEWHRERPDELTDGQLQELMILKFQSVEQIAQASDTQIMRLGMGAAGLRERGRMFLASRNAKVAGSKLTEQDAKIAELQALVAKLAAGSNMVQPSKKRTGWPKGKKRGVKDKVNEQHDNAPVGAASL